MLCHYSQDIAASNTRLLRPFSYGSHFGAISTSVLGKAENRRVLLLNRVAIVLNPNQTEIDWTDQKKPVQIEVLIATRTRKVHRACARILRAKFRRGCTFWVVFTGPLLRTPLDFDA